MPLGMEIGHIVLDGDPAPPKGAQPPIFGPCLLWPNGWIDQDAACWGHIVLDGGPASPLESSTAAPPHFSARVYCGQTAALIKMLLSTEVGSAQATLC